MDAFLFGLDIRELTMIQNPKIIKQKINKFDYVKIKKITRQKRYKQSQKTIHKTVIYMTNGYYINKILKTWGANIFWENDDKNKKTIGTDNS